MRRALPMLLFLSAAAPLERAVGETRRALLVGVGRYPEQCGWPGLAGVAGDVELMHAALLARGFHRSDVVILRDEQAKRRAIQEELEKLAAKSQQGDLVFFYFAGHGSRVPDDESDELDAIDETIVPYDACTSPDRRNDLRDDWIGDWIARANRQTDQVVLVFDCCSSGTVTRGGGAQRFLAPSARGFDLPRASLAPAAEPIVASGWVPPGKRYVALSACRSTESAFEIVVPAAKEGEPERVHGAFTWHVTHALHELGPEATYADVLARASASLRASDQKQTPVLEGSLAHYRLFRPEAPDARRIALEYVDGDWLLKSGRLDALTEGARFAVHAKPIERDTVATRIGEVRVDRVGRLESRARWVGPAPAAGLEAREFTAFLLERGREGLRLAVHVEGDDKAADELARRLEATNLVVATLPSEADFVLARERGGARERYVLQGRLGRALPVTASLASQDELNLLVDGLARLALARRTRAMLEDHATSAFAIEVRAGRVPVPGSEPGPELERDAQGVLSVRSGQELALFLTNRSTVPLAFELLWIGPDGEISSITGGGSEGELLEAGKTAIQALTGLEVPADRAAFYADAPVEILCIATPRWHDFTPLHQAPVPITTTRGGASGPVRDPLACEGWCARVVRLSIGPDER